MPASSQPDNSGGCMIALYPPRKLARALAVPGGLPAAEIHLTVAYTGAAADVDRKALKTVAKALAARGPVRAVISGHARFTGGDQDVIVALADSPDLENLRRDAMDQLAAAGIDVPRDHGYTPHLTIRYADAGDTDPVGRLPSVPVTFSRISVMHAKKRADYRLAGDTGIKAAARETYLAGWALSGGPWTEITEAGCAAAVQCAAESAADPAVLEATLSLGSLTGTWALVYARRDRLTRKHARRILAAWNDLASQLDPVLLVSGLRDGSVTSETVSPQRRRHQEAAIAAALAWLRQVRQLDGWDALVAALASAIRDGMAEGEAGALALAAARQGVAGLDIARAFRAARKRLRDLDVSQQAHDGAVRLADAAAGDAGRRLASLTWDDDGSDDDADIASDVGGTVSGDDVPAVDDSTHTAVWAAIGAGALALYMQAGTSVSWVTAGGNVCPVCEDNERNSPYAPQDVPPYPAHPRCVIGSTRVAVPAVVVSSDVETRDALELAVGNAGPAGDRSLLAASAVTGSVGDFGRGDVRAVSDRDYVGDVIVIRTALGHELTATPNHPVATRRGWVPIAELQVGDYVLSSTGAEWIVPSVDPDIDNIPPRIKDVAQSFPLRFGPVPTAPEDFHGDGAGSDVHVVRADRLLVDDVVASGTEHVCEGQFGGRGMRPVRAALLNAERSGDHELGRFGLPPDRIMGGSGQGGTILGSGVRHAQERRLAATPGLDPGAEETLADGTSAYADIIRDGFLAFAGEIPGDDGGLINGNLEPRDSGARLAAIAEHPGTEHDLADSAAADSEGFCERLLLLSGDIAADQLVHVGRREFRGHVYNLETRGGWYIGNGIVTHNCKCSLEAADSSPLSAYLAAYLS